jgi:hypothetical protein
MAHIENWCLRSFHFSMINKYEPGCFLHGEISGHLVISDCKGITSPLVELDLVAKTAVTLSGSHYTLGEPDAHYAKFLEEHPVATR